MPQTSDERRARWPGMDQEAIDYLQGQGYILTRKWQWQLPTPQHRPTEKEIDAAVYLIEEWDFDGIIYGQQE